MSSFKKIFLGFGIFLFISQFFGPEKNIGSTEALNFFIEDTKAPINVQNTLATACYDCHSNNTNYLWYSHITPINFWMADHIVEGKKELNLSEWANYSKKQKKHKMEEIYEEVEEKHMPISPYLITHTNANLTDEEIKDIVCWAKNNYSNY